MYHDRMRDRRPDVRDGAGLDPTLDFLRVLWRIEHALQRVSKRMETTLGVTGPQRLVLKIVKQFPGLTAGDVAHVVRLHPSTVTGILQRLETKGLVSRERDPADQRRVRLRVTPQAAPLTRRSERTVEAAVARALSGATASQARATRGLLSEIAVALEHNASDTRTVGGK